MKVQALIKMLENLEHVFGTDIDVSIRTASITVDGAKIMRVYCDEFLPVQGLGKQTMQEKRAAWAVRRRDIWQMVNEGAHAKDVAGKFSVCITRVHQICRDIDRKIARQKRLKAEDAA